MQTLPKKHFLWNWDYFEFLSTFSNATLQNTQKKKTLMQTCMFYLHIQNGWPKLINMNGTIFVCITAIKLFYWSSLIMFPLIFFFFFWSDFEVGTPPNHHPNIYFPPSIFRLMFLVVLGVAQPASFEPKPARAMNNFG